MKFVARLVALGGIGLMTSLAFGATGAQASPVRDAGAATANVKGHWNDTDVVGYYRSRTACIWAGERGEARGYWDDYDCNPIRGTFHRGGIGHLRGHHGGFDDFGGFDRSAAGHRHGRGHSFGRFDHRGLHGENFGGIFGGSFNRGGWVLEVSNCDSGLFGWDGFGRLDQSHNPKPKPGYNGGGATKPSHNGGGATTPSTPYGSGNGNVTPTHKPKPVTTKPAYNGGGAYGAGGSGR